MDKNMLEERALHRTVDVTAQTSVSTESEVKNHSIKQKTLEDTVITLDDMWIEDLQVTKRFCEVTDQSYLFIEVEKLGGNEGIVKTNAKATNSTVEEDLTRKASVRVISKVDEHAEVCKFRSVEEFSKPTLKNLFQDVESCRGECHVITQGEELESSDDIITLHELVKEDYFGDDQKIEVVNQSLLQATCRFESDQIEDRRNDISDYLDIHKGKSQPDEIGEILALFENHKNQTYRAKGSDARDRTVTSTTSQEWIKRNPNSDICLTLRDLSVLEEKDKITSCFQDHRKWPESQPSVSGVQQEFTPVASTEESLLLVTEEPYDSSSLKCKEINDENSDHSSIITGRCSDFISLESEKKRKKSSCSKLHLRTTGNSLSFVSHTSKLKYAEDLITLNGVILSPCKKQETSLSVRAFFAAEDVSYNQKKDANETEQKILLDMDVSMQKKKCEVEIYDRTVRDIDLREKQKYNLRQIVWLPLPRLGRDAIVGFVEEQTRNGHGGSTLSPSENKELKEMLRQLASDNVPGPQITMKYEMLRLCTMKSFPGGDRPFAIRIVGAGFYYAGHKDQVICYSCGSRKEGWVLGDIPLLIHQKMAPDCGFLTHNALVNVPIKKVNSSADVRLVTIQRSDGSNQSDMAQGESSLMLPSSEQNQVSVLNTPHQMLVTNKSLPSNQLIDSGRQNVLDNLQTVSTDTYSMEEPPPKYPQYAVKNMRINSFHGWPAELQQKPEEMAECGFYYAGFSDCVRCFHCGVGLRHWMSEDDPWIEHARWSTECIYVLKMKGEEFVSLVKMAVEIAEREEAIRNDGGNQALQNSNETAPAVLAKEGPNKSDTTNSNAAKDLPSNVGATDGNVVRGAAATLPHGNSEIQKYLLTDAAQSVLDMGYQPKLVLHAVERVLMRKGSEELTGQIIMEAVFEIEEADKPQSKTQPVSLESADKAKITNDASNKQDGQQGHVASGNTQTEESQIDPEKIMREHRELREVTLCKICLENTSCVVFLPCGHLVTCSDCAPAMRKCPICRTLIKGTVKTFYG
ncbi:hypothetical protein CHS0354_010981 [Potamilus streckersoni]|nr:hypothetical protein CHS0354_010981 [Potamilus streckersoni]